MENCCCRELQGAAGSPPNTVRLTGRLIVRKFKARDLRHRIVPQGETLTRHHGRPLHVHPKANLRPMLEHLEWHRAYHGIGEVRDGVGCVRRAPSRLNTGHRRSRFLRKSNTLPNRPEKGSSPRSKTARSDDPSENAAWIGLARYQLIVGKPHPITAAIARMHPEDQDVIDDFLLEVASRGLSLKGQFFSHLVREAVTGADSPGEQEVAGLVPSELLRMAKAWKKDPEAVLARLK